MNLPLRSMTVTGMLTSVVLTRTTSPSPTSSGSLGEGVEVLPEEDCDPWRPPELIVVPVCRTGRWRGRGFALRPGIGRGRLRLLARTLADAARARLRLRVKNCGQQEGEEQGGA